jgi:hypothetical protein
MAFRLDGAGSLVAFAGYNCQRIAIDGREFVFASRSVSLVAWAPVVPHGQMPGVAAEASVLRRGMRKDWIFADEADMMGGVISVESAEIRLRSSFPLVLGPLWERARRL